MFFLNENNKWRVIMQKKMHGIKWQDYESFYLKNSNQYFFKRIKIIIIKFIIK